MSFPSTFDIDKIRQGDAEPLVKDLPKETVGNVLINALAQYRIVDRKEVFFVQQAAAKVLAGEEIPTLLLDFLVNSVMPCATLRTIEEDGKKREDGVYSAWVVAQVYAALGHPDGSGL